MTASRNFDEILRTIDSIQLTAKHQVATPANWKPGDDVIMTEAVSNEDAITRFGSFELCCLIFARPGSLVLGQANAGRRLGRYPASGRDPSERGFVGSRFIPTRA